MTSVYALWVGCGFPLGGEAIDGETEEPPEFVHEGTNAAALTRSVTCDDVLEQIRDGVISRLIERAEQLRQPPQYYDGEPGVIVDPGEMMGPPPGVPDGDDVAPPSEGNPTDSSGNSPGSSGAAGSSGFSGTTVQVSDVDEADDVKTDGDYVYVLQGNSVVQVLAWPTSSLETKKAFAIEGTPIEMFARSGKLLVYSQVYRDLSQPDPYGYNPYYDYYPYYPYSSSSYTKLTVVDMSGEEALMLRESYLEGDYRSARRHDSVVRTITQNWSKAPQLDGVYIEYLTPCGEPYRQQDIDAQVDAWLERTIWAVGETEIGDWLPRQFSVVDGQPVEREPSCQNYYAPDLDVSQSGVTSITSLDLDSDDGQSALDGVTVLARAERVYANDAVVLLAQTDYGTFETNYTEQTTLHRFDLDGAETAYSASGVLPGYVHDQFSLDEHEGLIRVSTTQNVWNPEAGEQAGPKNRVFTVATNDGWLDVYGQTEVFGQNEQIFATRFIGDLGYVVTFRQIDPLFVVDLRSPRRPRVVGELEVPGFSNFLFPLDEGHLLAIGRDASPEGFAQGIALSIFDVTDPAYPALEHRYVYDASTYSNAEADHRAITFHPDGGRIAFPLQNWQTGVSSLEVFDVSAEAGFDRRGAIVPTTQELTLDECALRLGYTEADLEWLHAEVATFPEYGDYILSQCRYAEQMRRGVFRDDYVYGITTAAIYAHGVDDLAGDPLGQATLPPSYYYPYYYGPGVMMPGAGGGSFEGNGGSDFVNQGGSAGTASGGEGGGAFAAPSGSAGESMTGGSGGASGG